MSHHPSDPEYTSGTEPLPVPDPDDFDPIYRSVEAATDWLGNRFRVGDKVLYCVGAGRGQMMAIGTVVKMRACDVSVRGYGQPTEIRTDVTVQVLTEKTSGSWDNRPRTRPAWVNPMNITSLRLEGEK